MLDEPSLGLAPRLVDEVMALVRRIRDEDVTVKVRGKAFRVPAHGLVWVRPLKRDKIPLDNPVLNSGQWNK